MGLPQFAALSGEEVPLSDAERHAGDEAPFPCREGGRGVRSSASAYGEQTCHGGADEQCDCARLRHGGGGVVAALHIVVRARGAGIAHTVDDIAVGIEQLDAGEEALVLSEAASGP